MRATVIFVAPLILLISGPAGASGPEQVAPTLLPRGLPALPLVGDPTLVRLVLRARALPGTNAQRYLWLERQGATLRGDASVPGRRRARALQGYLARYKADWAARWVAERLHAFTGQVRERALCEARFAPAVGPEVRRRFLERLSRAERIFTGAVNPVLWRDWPAIPVEVSQRHSVAGIVADAQGRRVITLRPDSTVKDMLHELGHITEYRAGPNLLATAHAARARRARRSVPRPLRALLPGTRYPAQVTAYDGGYVDQYMGRYYRDGYTEVVSMCVERFRSAERMLDLFYRDGDYLLVLLTALQTPRDPRR